MHTRGTRVHTAALTEVVHEFYSPVGWYLGTVMKDGLLQRFSDLFPTQDAARRVLDVLRDAGVQDEDFLSMDAAGENYCDVGVTGFADPLPRHFVAVALVPSARMRVLHYDRTRLQRDLALPGIRTVIQIVRWCRTMAVWNSPAVLMGHNV
jgi:hypothetical protein